MKSILDWKPADTPPEGDMMCGVAIVKEEDMNVIVPAIYRCTTEEFIFFGEVIKPTYWAYLPLPNSLARQNEKLMDDKMNYFKKLITQKDGTNS